ncbi:hypothetical protein G5B40_08995 [Pikeienuella piscinae]|uniref:Acyltransferase 3 domain-containing protein n=1 Tax=Pikeienuella piscinae TaxID=2748098 RepID=A0A7L5BTV1_9RHOB|nr:hypothetical protein [Pikeienuella piscinae]QIE55580.1 hypothetical protein G5B40_08995 [Pikeienuella piscinae]
MFMMLLVYFGAGRPLAERARRLLTPWLIWSAIYGALKMADAIASGHPLSDEFDWWMLTTGPSIHLWFLPFGFAFVALAQVLESTIARVAVVVIGFIVFWRVGAVSLSPPLREWMFVAPAAIVGLAMRWWSPSLVLALAVVAVVLAASLGPGPMTVWKLGIAALVVLAAILAARPGTPDSTWLGSPSLGIYLIHPAVAAVAARSGLQGWPLYLVVAGGSIAAAILIRRYAGWLA